MVQRILVLVLALSSAPAAAQYKPLDGHMRVSRQAVNAEYLGDVRALGRDALALQQSDGGKLSAVHLSRLQAKLDRLNATYQERLKYTDPLRINADGSMRDSSN